MTSWRKLLVPVFAGLVAIGVAGCDDTWRGLKQDTGENLERTGEALDRAGEKVQGEEEQQ